MPTADTQEIITGKTIPPKRVPPPYSFGSETLKLILPALIFTAVLIALWFAWRYREVILFRLRAGNADIIEEMLHEAANGTNYGWSKGPI